MDTRARIAHLEDVISRTPSNSKAWVQARPIPTCCPAVWVMAVIGDQWEVYPYASHLIEQGWKLLAYMPQHKQKIVVHMIRRVQEPTQ